MLARVGRLDDGRWVALASKFLSGKPLGPAPQHGRRKDDPNDRVNHENRRELRGLYAIAAWINHFDLKQHQTLDMYVEDGGRRYVEHNLLDFASTLGAGAGVTGPVRRYGYEFGFDLGAITSRTVTLGFREDRWRRLERDHGFSEVGYFEWKEFKPDVFRTLQPNWWFANRTPRDNYWGAKIVGAFRDEHIDAIVDAGQYIEPGAAAYVKKALRIRRDTIVRFFFDQTPPLDFFRPDGAALVFEDLGLRYEVYDARHHAVPVPVRPGQRRPVGGKDEPERLDAPRRGADRPGRRAGRCLPGCGTGGRIPVPCRRAAGGSGRWLERDGDRLYRPPQRQRGGRGPMKIFVVRRARLD